MEPFDLRLWPLYAAAGGDLSQPAVIDQVCIDSRRIASPQSLFVALQGQLDGHDFLSNATQQGARFAIVAKQRAMTNPDPKRLTLLHVDSPLAAFQSLAKSYRLWLGSNVRVIAIAGSTGKTMLKDLLQPMIEQTWNTVASPESFNSQIGVALSLMTIKRQHQVALIEAAISKNGEMQILADMIAPDATVVTHIGKKHLSTLGSLDNTAAEFAKLLQFPSQQLWKLIPDSPYLSPFVSNSFDNFYLWNRSCAQLPHAQLLTVEHSLIMPYRLNFPTGQYFTDKITSGFSYCLDLINMAVKAAWLLDVPFDNICNVLRNYTPEPSRTEIWKSPLGSTFINDTYCGDPQSLARSLNFFDYTSEGRKIFVFDGMRGNNHSSSAYKRIGQALHNAAVDLLVTTEPLPDTVLQECQSNTEVVTCAHYQEALSYLAEEIRPNDTVLIKGAKKHSLHSLMEAFNDSITHNQCFINLEAIKSNIDQLRNKLSRSTHLMVIVKALAYGTDDVRIAKFLATCGIDILGVSYVDEGIALKRAGIQQAIFVINAALYEAAKVVKWQLDVGVSDADMIEALAQEAHKQNKSINVHLHVDTGMCRLGCRPENALTLARKIVSSTGLKLTGIMTHFACSEQPHQDSFTLQQTKLFDAAIAELAAAGIHPHWRHAANSAAALRFDFPQYNMARIGLATYGFGSYHPRAQECLQLQPALALMSRIVAINLCQAGETVSYGRSYTVERDQARIAVLPIGYFDGLHRAYRKAEVLIRGHKAPIVGNICMDFTMVDITDIPSATIGDPVLIFGEDEHGCYVAPEEFAHQGASIVHELMTCLGPRIQRIFIHEEK